MDFFPIDSLRFISPYSDEIVEGWCRRLATCGVAGRCGCSILWKGPEGRHAWIESLCSNKSCRSCICSHIHSFSLSFRTGLVFENALNSGSVVVDGFENVLNSGRCGGRLNRAAHRRGRQRCTEELAGRCSSSERLALVAAHLELRIIPLHGPLQLKYPSHPERGA